MSPTTSYAPKIGDNISTLDTPSMIVNLPLMESNISSLISSIPPTISIRPHLKTSKSSAIAKKLSLAGCKGGCVAKISEAEIMCSKGFSDLLITSPIVGEVKVRRLVELWRRYRDVKVVVDDAGAASRVDDEISRTKGEEKMKVLLDLDVGLHRTGVQPGIQGYEGHLQHVPTYSLRKQQTLEAMTTLTSSADSLRQAGHDISIVSTAGTGTYPFCISVPGITEIQPGSFIFMDTDYRNCLEDSPQQKIPKFSNSVSILSTVISVQGPNYVTIDAGLKSLTTDSGLAECKESRFIYGVMGDEHGSLTWDANASEQDSADGIGKEVKDWKKSVKGLKIGDRIEMLPSHIDPTINLHNVYYAHRDGIIEEIWEVEGRGCVQ